MVVFYVDYVNVYRKYHVDKEMVDLIKWMEKKSKILDDLENYVPFNFISINNNKLLLFILITVLKLIQTI